MVRPYLAPAPVSLVLVCSLLAGCSGGLYSRTDRDTLEPEGGYGAAFVDTRPLVADVTELRIENTPGGAILRATGLPPTQGYWDIALTRDRATPPSDGVLRFDFRARPPVNELGQTVAAPVGTVRSRQVQAAVYIERSALDGVRQIIVTGQQSSRSVRR